MSNKVYEEMLEKHLEKTIEVAKRYTLRGWYPIPCIGKKPGKWTTKIKDDGKEIKSSQGYNKLRITEDEVPEYFERDRLDVSRNVPVNVAIVADSHKLLTDIDLDNDSCRQLAKWFLPDTLCMFGRKTSRGSHRLYNCKHSAYRKFYYLKDPSSKGKDNEVVLLEIRPLDGSRYTVFPPSIHVDTSEEIGWERNLDNTFTFNKEPGEIDSVELEECCKRLAVAGILADEWTSGIRQDLCLAVAGTLFKIGWEKVDVDNFLEPIYQLFDDPGDIKDRKQGVEHTHRKFLNGEAVTGISKLSELLSGPQFQFIKDVLGITKTESPIQEEDGCITCRKFVKDLIIKEKISSFIMRPEKSIYIAGEGNYFDVRLQSRRGSSRILQFGPRSFINSRSFKETVSTVQDAQEFMYIGSDTQTQQLNEYLADQEYRRVLGSKMTGFQVFDDVLYFVTEDGSMTADCKLDDTVTYVGPEKSYCKLPFVTVVKNDLFKMKKNLLEFNTPAIVQGVLGWTVSCFFKRFFMGAKEIDGYPLLYMSGESGSGKSQTAKSIIYGIWDVQENPLDFKGQTEFTLMLGSTMSNAIPVVLDEVKLNRLGVKYQNIFSRYVRAAFDDSKMKRGNKDKTATYYSIQRPTVVCSEVWPNETAIKERCLFLNLSQKESYQRTEQYKDLITQDLGMIGRMVLEYALNLKEEEVYDRLIGCYDALPTSFEGRPAICLLSSTFGLSILSELLKVDIGTEEITGELFNHFYSHVDGDTKMFKTSEVDKTIVEFNRMCEYEGTSPTFGSMVHNTHLQYGHHYTIREGKIRLYLGGILPVFHKFAKEYNYDGDILDKTTFRNQVMNEVYFVEEKVAKIGDHSRRCIILDIELMEKKGLDIGHPWVESDPEPKDNVVELKKEN